MFLIFLGSGVKVAFVRLESFSLFDMEHVMLYQNKSDVFLLTDIKTTGIYHVMEGVCQLPANENS